MLKMYPVVISRVRRLIKSVVVGVIELQRLLSRSGRDFSPRPLSLINYWMRRSGVHVKNSSQIERTIMQRGNRFAISGMPFLAALLVFSAAIGLYRFGDGANAVGIFSYSILAIWGLICWRGADRTCLDEGYWLAASGMPFAVVSYFIGPLPRNVCIILATILAVGTAIEFMVRDDADLRKLAKDFRTPRA